MGKNNDSQCTVNICTSSVTCDFRLTVDGTAGTLVWYIVWEYFFYHIALKDTKKNCIEVSVLMLNHTPVPTLSVLVEIIA